MCMRYILFFLFPFVSYLRVFATQPGDTLHLKEVNISSTRLQKFAVGHKVEIIDSLTKQAYAGVALSNLLAEQSAMYVKAYGPSGIATVSFRGSNANHTPVLWNGINLQSPMLGQVDFSLIPIIAADEISIQYGGAGALCGSGAIGGVVHLNSPLNFNQGLKINATLNYGSFNDWSSSAGVSISKDKCLHSSKFYHRSALNNFTFYNNSKAGNPLERLSNAALNQWAYIQENAFKLNEKQVLNIRYWYQQSDRQVAPGMAQQQSTAQQFDQAQRALLHWQYSGKLVALNIKQALLSEALNYDDSISHINSQNQSLSVISEVESNFNIHTQHKFDAGINNTYNMARAQAYGTSKAQERFALFAAYKWESKSNTKSLVLSARQEWLDGKILPLSPALGFEIDIIPNLYLKGKASRNYRIPTFNDLYWIPGGNRNLVAEQGWSEDLGLYYSTQKGNIQYKASVNIYNSLINNWIVWLPTENYWAPANIMQVWSRGLESDWQVLRNSGKIQWTLRLNTAYTLASNQQLKAVNDESLYKQLIYVPIYKGFVNAGAGYKSYRINYHCAYTGYRYTSSDNSSFLDPYILHHITLSKDLRLAKCAASLFFKVNNIANSTYQLVAGRPMPLRFYQSGISFSFHNKSTKHKQND